MPNGQQLTEEQLKNMTPEQIAELQKQQCIFCGINEGKVPAKKVYEDEICFAILDINPATKGHMLLIPKEHYMVLPQMPENLVKHLGNVAKKLSRAAIRSLGAEGTNIFVANGAIAGQRAPHAIVHIIPRVENDAITVFEFPEKSIPEETLTKLQTALAQKLGTKLEAPVPAAEPIPPVEKEPELEIKEEGVVAEAKPAEEAEIELEEAGPGPKVEKEVLDALEKEEIKPEKKEIKKVKRKAVKKEKKKPAKKEELEEVGLDDIADMLSR